MNTTDQETLEALSAAFEPCQLLWRLSQLPPRPSQLSLRTSQVPCSLTGPPKFFRSEAFPITSEAIPAVQPVHY